jgi:4-aminobutyrate aminotransferase-like enzyme
MSDEREAPTGDVLEAPPPRLTDEAAARVANEVFGVPGATLQRFGSERDQNFLVGAPDGPKAVLKISNAGEDPAVLEMETRAALHVHRVDPGLPLAIPLPAEGDPERFVVGVVDPVGGGSHMARLFTHLEGRASVEGTELDLDAIAAYGSVTARLGRALRSFFHPSAGRVLLWDPQRALLHRPNVEAIGDPDLRSLVGRALDAFEERALTRWPHLRLQVVHGDLTLDNALLGPDDRICGIVDFGDMTHTALICDLVAAMDSVLGLRDVEGFFAGAAAMLDGYRAVTPLEDVELAALGDVLVGRLAATLVISAVRVATYPENAEYITGWDEHATTMLRIWDEVGADEWSARLSQRVLRASAVPEAGELARRRQAVFGPALSPLTYSEPLSLERGQGVWFVDVEGRRFLDAYNNVPVVGHAHPRVAEAVARQSRRLATNLRYLHPSAIELGERLVASMPEGSGLDTVFLVNSGSEATDLAYRLAVAATGNRGGLVTARAYHGVSAAVADLSPEEWLDGRKPEHVETFTPPDGYRGPDENESLRSFDHAVERLCERGSAPATTFVDLGFTSDGILTPSSAFVAALVERTHAAGGLFLADEVQAGYGRSGGHLWSFESSGIAPDLVALGKPMGNGFPVAAVITRRDVAQALAERASFFSTFGGNPVAAEAAIAVLDVIRDYDLIARVGVVGRHLIAALRGLAADHPAIGQVRGMGLLIGVDLVRDRVTREPAPEVAAAVLDGMRARGVLVGSTGPADNVLKIRPPLVLTESEADLIVETLAATLADLEV